MFHKTRGITLYIDQQIQPLFLVQEVKRDGPRLILTGKTPLAAGWEWARIEVVLRHGEIRFDDIVDKSGRSIRYERFRNEPARRAGISTIGDVLRLVLDLKPCNAEKRLG